MINASNSDQRRAASSNLCEEIFSSATEHTEELEHNIDVNLQAQDVRQRHHPGEQNRNEERYGEDVKILLMTSTKVNIIFSRLVSSRRLVNTYYNYLPSVTIGFGLAAGGWVLTKGVP